MPIGYANKMGVVTYIAWGIISGILGLGAYILWKLRKTKKEFNKLKEDIKQNGKGKFEQCGQKPTKSGRIEEGERSPKGDAASKPGGEGTRTRRYLQVRSYGFIEPDNKPTGENREPDGIEKSTSDTSAAESTREEETGTVEEQLTVKERIQAWKYRFKTKFKACIDWFEAKLKQIKR